MATAPFGAAMSFKRHQGIFILLVIPAWERTSPQSRNDSSRFDLSCCQSARISLGGSCAYAEAGVPNGVRMFYSVRHAYATDMANKGMELPELARLLGHSDLSMSYRYYNLTKGTLDKARNILNRRAVVNG